MKKANTISAKIDITPETTDYRNWLLIRVCSVDEIERYSKLWDKLFTTEYYWTIERDSGRASDGLYLRDSYDGGKDIWFNAPCMVLEMLVALCIRCDKEIAGDVLKGDRASVWFWEILDNLGLGSMDDSRYDEFYVEQILKIFMENRYEADGAGGPFYMPGFPKDLSKNELWYQMIWYNNWLAR